MLIQPDQFRFIIDKLGMNCFVLVLRLSDFSEIVYVHIFFENPIKNLNSTPLPGVVFRGVEMNQPNH